jgi:hypothetical protein
MAEVYDLGVRKNHVGYLSILAILTVQCSLSIDTDRKQCKTDEDCRSHGSAFSGSICENSICAIPKAWACLFNQPEQAVTGGDGPYTVRIPVVSVLTQKPVSDVSVRICAKIDADCLSPLGKAVTSDSEGIVTLKVDAKFDGFITLSHPDFGTSLYFFNPAVTKDQTVSPVRLASSEMAAMLIAQVGGTFDPSRGSIVITADDCTGAAGEGVTYSTNLSDSRIASFYSESGLPTTKTTNTDSSGYGGFMDVPPGNLTITGNHRDFGLVGKMTLFVKAGTTSYSRMVPYAQP